MHLYVAGCGHSKEMTCRPGNKHGTITMTLVVIQITIELLQTSYCSPVCERHLRRM